MNLQNSIVMKLKTPNCDETQKFKLWWNSKTQIVMKLKMGTKIIKKKMVTKIIKKKWWQIHKLKLWQNLKTQIVTKLKFWQSSN